MKKSLLLLFFIANVFCANSQEIKFGVKGGLNLSSLSGNIDDEVDKKPVFGFHVGGIMNIPLIGKFIIQPELLLSTQGSITEYSDTYANGNESYTDKGRQTIKLMNINLPILFQYELIDGLNIGVGAQIGYVIRAKSKLEYISEEYPEDNESVEYSLLKEEQFDFLGMTMQTKKDGVNRLDAGLLFGASYTLNNGLFFQGRYNLGLIKVIKDVTDIQTGNIESRGLKNSVFQISIGYVF